jgi:PhzF family phenazine biosynthesis protein
MISLPIYQVDAFTSSLFGGNPAAVMPLENWLEDGVLQAIALENNLSETAFFVPAPGGGANEYELRWFTPQAEIDLCGHATLATAHVLFHDLGAVGDILIFRSLSGELQVTREGDFLVLNFPTLSLQPCTQVPDALAAGLGAEPASVLEAGNGNYYAVFETENEVRQLTPDFSTLECLPKGVVVTAPGSGSNYDCVSRFFAPGIGIPEDPVTGSVHCALVPYWCGRLGKSKIHAFQASARGGELQCRLSGDRVLLAGKTVRYMIGTAFI